MVTNRSEVSASSSNAWFLFRVLSIPLNQGFGYEEIGVKRSIGGYGSEDVVVSLCYAGVGAQDIDRGIPSLDDISLDPDLGRFV